MEKSTVASAVFFSPVSFFQICFQWATAKRHRRMADEHEHEHEQEPAEGPEGDDIADVTETPEFIAPAETVSPPIAGLDNGNAAEDLSEENIPDFVVNLVVNELPEGATLAPSQEIIDAALTDAYGNRISSATQSIVDYISTQIGDNEMNGNGTALTGGKGRWWGWSPLKIALVALIALCIIGIIVAIIFMITRNLKKKNRKSPGGGAAPAPKGSTAKGTSQPKYESVPTV